MPKQSSSSNLNPAKNPPMLLLAAAVVLGLGFLAVMSQRDSGENSPSRREIPKESQTDLVDDPSSINTIVLGSKGESLSLVSAINDSGKNETPVSKLSDFVKFITPIVDGRHLFYVADINFGDMGDSFELQKIVPEGESEDGKISKVYTTTDGYKIDRYVISENNRWIAWYEVRGESEDEYTHESDFYRVYKAELGKVLDGAEELTPVKISEVQAGPGVQISLPSIVTDEGRVFFDSIIPSTYALHYGFRDEASNSILPLNTYNSTPYLIDQRYLLYSAFEAGNSKLPSTNDSDSTRDEIVNTNIVKVTDLESKEVIVVAPGDEGEHYKHPVFVDGDVSGDLRTVSEVYRIDNSGGSPKLAFSEIQMTTKHQDGSFSKLIIQNEVLGKLRILEVGELPNGDKTVLVGKEIDLRGNLGTGNGIGPSGYKNKLASILVFNLESGELMQEIIPESISDFEFISVMPKTTEERLGIERNMKLVEKLSVGVRQLKLTNFVPIEPRRVRKNPRSECETEWEQKGYPNYEACEACPVYVYSKEEKNVSVRPLTPISNASAVPPLANDRWDFVADNVGNLNFNGETYKRIDYDFPRGDVAVPLSGVVLAQKDISRGIADYAYSLGFNTREVEDIVTHFKAEVGDAKYIYFSTLPQDDAKKLLDLSISPQPESYMSHIFYAKKIDSPSDIVHEDPLYSPFIRRDYTVVVWGSIIE